MPAKLKNRYTRVRCCHLEDLQPAEPLSMSALVTEGLQVPLSTLYCLLSFLMTPLWFKNNLTIIAYIDSNITRIMKISLQIRMGYFDMMKSVLNPIHVFILPNVDHWRCDTRPHNGIDIDLA